jgi:hypothetical protein
LEREKDSSLHSQNSNEPPSLLNTLLAFFAGAFLFSLFSRRHTAYGESTYSNRTQDSTENNRQRQQDVPTSPMRVVVESLPLSNTPLEERKAEKEKDRRPQWWMLGVNTLTLFAVIWYACVATQQRNAMIESNQINRDALYSVQRAFIASKNFDQILNLYDFTNEKSVRMLGATAHWENIGNTPAIGVMVGFGSIQQDADLSEEQFTSIKGSEEFFRPSALNPKEIVDSPTVHQRESWFKEDPQQPWFYYGWVVYRDIFPKTKSHVTEFCWRVTEIKWPASVKGKAAGKPILSARACSAHNCVDETCEDYTTIINLRSAK